MIEAMLKARSQEDFVDRGPGLRPGAASGAYVVPLYFQPDQWMARWSRSEHPRNDALYPAISCRPGGAQGERTGARKEMHR